ncbi:hypothetical protein DPMN_167883 [Dreissena polymorpha]|uniref:Uncharacterized protein n=1 Tax=Dreissena polymorpha TaxID=45954 RepID=A0A9D4IZ12_DREPO|nr:hypothetical protein DPMN_167883 [Dreissena polymorpha]
MSRSLAKISPKSPSWPSPDYHSGGSGLNAPSWLRILHFYGDKENNSESGCELFNGFWVRHADARQAVAGMSGP